MTVFKVGNVYYTEDSIHQYINENHSFADFIASCLEDNSGSVYGLINSLFAVWNSDKQESVVQYIDTLARLYAGYINNILLKIPKYTVIEGSKTQSENQKDE